jgi:hypothetical protein
MGLRTTVYQSKGVLRGCVHSAEADHTTTIRQINRNQYETGGVLQTTGKREASRSGQRIGNRNEHTESIIAVSIDEVSHKNTGPFGTMQACPVL